MDHPGRYVYFGVGYKRFRVLEESSVLGGMEMQLDR